jgi:hypothetical protein
MVANKRTDYISDIRIGNRPFSKR